MARQVGDLWPHASGTSSLGVDQINGSEAGFSREIRPFSHIHQNSGVWHDGGLSGLLRFNGRNGRPSFEMSFDGGKEFPLAIGSPGLGITHIYSASGDMVIASAAFLDLTSQKNIAFDAVNSMTLDAGGSFVIEAAGGITGTVTKNAASFEMSANEGDVVLSAGTVNKDHGQVFLLPFAGSGNLSYKFGPHEAWHTTIGAGNLNLVPIPHSGHVVQMIEESSINLLHNRVLYPERFDKWGVAVASATVYPDIGFAPDGTFTADIIQDPSAGVFRGVRETRGIPSDSNSYMFSMFVKKDPNVTAVAGVNFRITGSSTTVITGPRFRVDTGEFLVAGGSLIDYNDQWYRLYSDMITSDGGHDTVQADIFPAARLLTGGGDTAAASGMLVAWGAQIEVVENDAERPTPYISRPITTINDVRSGSGVNGVPNGNLTLAGVNGIEVSSPADFNILLDGAALSGLIPALSLQSAYDGGQLIITANPVGPVHITGDESKCLSLDVDEVAGDTYPHILMSGITGGLDIGTIPGDLWLQGHTAGVIGQVSPHSNYPNDAAEAKAWSLGPQALFYDSGSGVVALRPASGIAMFLNASTSATIDENGLTLPVGLQLTKDKFCVSSTPTSSDGIRVQVAGMYRVQYTAVLEKTAGNLAQQVDTQLQVDDAGGTSYQLFGSNSAAIVRDSSGLNHNTANSTWVGDLQQGDLVRLFATHNGVPPAGNTIVAAQRSSVVVMEWIGPLGAGSSSRIAL